MPRPWGADADTRASKQAVVDEVPSVKDFSLFYGPVRSWLPVVVMAVLGLIVFVNQSSSSEASCDQVGATCAEPLLGERQLLGSGDGLDGPATPLAEDTEPSAWESFDPEDNPVPFVSLRPSPEPMTEAGEDLVRSAVAGNGPEASEAGP